MREEIVELAPSVAAAELANESEAMHGRDEDVAIVPIPALLVVLIDKEKEKGSPLTRREVESLRKQVRCMALPRSLALALQSRRGYADVDLDKCWEDWCARRACLSVAQLRSRIGASGARCDGSR
jgi:hypothetical protein